MRSFISVLVLVVLSACGKDPGVYKACDQTYLVIADFKNQTAQWQSFDYIVQNGRTVHTVALAPGQTQVLQVRVEVEHREPHNDIFGQKHDAQCTGGTETKRAYPYLNSDPAAAAVKFCTNIEGIVIVEKTSACPDYTEEQKTAGLPRY